MLIVILDARSESVMMKARSVIAIVSLILLGCAVVSGINPTDRFAGSWRLVSAEGRSSDGTVTPYLGEHPAGRLMFDTGGRLSLHLVDMDRPNFKDGDFLRGTPAEVREAFNGYFGYFGSYTVDPIAETITFHIEGAAYPNYIGSDQVRYFEISEDKLILKTPPERAGGQDIVYYITWEREQ